MALAAWLGGAAGCLEADFASLDIDADGRVPQFGLRHSASVPTAHHAPPRSQDVRHRRGDIGIKPSVLEVSHD